MRRIIMNFIEITIFMILIAVFLFMFVDCKIENVRLKTKYETMTERVHDLENELTGIRNVYTRTLIPMIQSNKISLEELSQQLPAQEYRYLQEVLLIQHKMDKK